MGLSIPTPLIGGKSDTPEQRAYLDALSCLPNFATIPPVVLGIARFYVHAPWHAGTLKVLEHSSNKFWQAVGRAFEPFQWRVSAPNVVCRDSPHFDAQSKLVTNLTSVLQRAGAFTPSRVDKERQEHAKKIIGLMSELRQALDAQTGYEPNGDWRGLLSPDPWSILSSLAILRADSLVPRAPGEGYVPFEGLSLRDADVVHRLTLQELLAASEMEMAVEANICRSPHREAQGRHRRFALQVVEWFDEVARETEGDTPAPQTEIVETTAAILRAYFPSEPDLIKKRPLG